MVYLCVYVLTLTMLICRPDGVVLRCSQTWSAGDGVGIVDADAVAVTADAEEVESEKVDQNTAEYVAVPSFLVCC